MAFPNATLAWDAAKTARAGTSAVAGGTGFFSKLFAGGGNPYVTAASLALPVITSLFERAFPSKQSKILNQVLEERAAFSRKLQRHARGDFSQDERAEIERIFEPMVNRVVGGVGARGLDASGAGQDEIIRAQMEPFFRIQEQAMAYAGQATGELFQTVNQLAAIRPSITQQIGQLAQTHLQIAWISELQGRNSRDQALDGLAQKLKALDERITKNENLRKSK